MKRSKLLLERHFFTKIALNFNETGDASVSCMVSSKLEGGRSIASEFPGSVEMQDHYRVMLTVRLISPPEKLACYTGEISTIGFFRVDQSVPVDKQAKFVIVNGATLLFGAVREMVANLTARGPAPSVTLVAVDFSETPVQESADADVARAKDTRDVKKPRRTIFKGK